MPRLTGDQVPGRRNPQNSEESLSAKKPNLRTERPDPEKELWLLHVLTGRQACAMQESTAWFGTASGSGKLKKTLQDRAPGASKVFLKPSCINFKHSCLIILQMLIAQPKPQT